MSDPRKDLIRQMMALRGRLDPRLLEQAKLAVFGQVPYDRDNARAAVGRFLENRNDGGAFRRKLEAELRKDGATLDLDGAADGAPKGPGDGGPPPRPRRIGRIA